MKLLKIVLKPLEPYFFGNERSLLYKGIDQETQSKAASYFAKSEKVPLQSTLFGTLRYLGIANKRADFKLSLEDVQNIGSASFQLKGEGQSFGKIKRISNLFLVDKEERLYIPVPADQENFSGNDKKYQGVKVDSFGDKVVTQNGVRYLPKVDMKNGFFEGYMRVDDGVCVSTDDIFENVVRTGIDINQKNDAYFKKQYCFMRNHSFLFFAEVEDDFPQITDKYVKMGHGKNTFLVTVKEETIESNEKHEWDKLVESDQFNISSGFPVEAVKVVILSDSYVKEIKELYSCCYFIHSDIREYRALETNYNARNQKERYKKKETLLRLLKAGSVFWINPDKKERFEELLNNNEAKIAGFNLYKIGGKK